MTLIPKPETYGHYEGWVFDDPDGRVWSVGETPEECVIALAKARGWGEVDMSKFRDLPEDPDENLYHWGVAFYAGGTSFKAAGQNVPGGLVLTWWK